MTFLRAKLLVFCLAGVCSAFGTEQQFLQEPFGVCAHVSRGELDIAPQGFSLMRQIGIRWVRTDFDWAGVEKQPGVWDFSHLDRLAELARNAKMEILPILDYDVPWATPAWRHLKEWSNYVSRVVSRYSGDFRCWEVWNEQNMHGFWRDSPDAGHYCELLKRTYQEIKNIDPELTVVYGGTAGIPLTYIENSYAAGAGDFFDVMNIHPYNWQDTPEAMIPQLKTLQALMEKYRIQKPVWISEVGWSTARPPAFFGKLLDAAFRMAGVVPEQSTVALLCDPESEFAGALNFDTKSNLKGFKAVEIVTFRQLQELDVQKHSVLIPAIGEAFPARYIPDLVRYVRQGGTLLLPTGLPFYYDLQADAAGNPVKVQMADHYLSQFHIGWEAWWTKEGVPRQETYQKPGPDFNGKFEVSFQPSGRFLHDRNLKKGDRFIPIIEAGTEQYRGAVAALYKLNSDLKGNIIVCTTTGIAETVPEERQAEMLPRTYLIALACNVERIFWYNFRSAEWKADEREAHFGIVHADLQGKPAWTAMKTLAELCPSGSTVPVLEKQKNVYLAHWNRPDGVRIWALWSAFYPEKVKWNIQGDISRAVDFLGRPLSISPSDCQVSPAVVYLVGPEQISLR